MDDNSISLSPLEALSGERYQGKTYIQERAVSIGTTRSIILDNNPNRLAWDLINTSLIEIRISNSPDLASTTGFLLSPSGGEIGMNYQEDGEGSGYAVYAISTAAGATAWIREVIRS